MSLHPVPTQANRQIIRRTRAILVEGVAGNDAKTETVSLSRCMSADLRQMFSREQFSAHSFVAGRLMDIAEKQIGRRVTPSAYRSRLASDPLKSVARIAIPSTSPFLERSQQTPIPPRRALNPSNAFNAAKLLQLAASSMRTHYDSADRGFPERRVCVPIHG